MLGKDLFIALPSNPEQPVPSLESAHSSPSHQGVFVFAGPAFADSSTPQGASFGKGIDPIYPIFDGVAGQMPVTAAAPGDSYHGGRWAVHVVTWNTAPYLLTSDETVLVAAAVGDVTITRMPAADFVCPVAGR